MSFNITKLGQNMAVVLLCILLSTNLSWAARLHMFIVAQASDPQIYSAKDNDKMKRLAEEICVTTGMTLEKHYFEKSTLTEEKLKTELANLNCGTDDVVWFYYSGHGANANGKWPFFTLNGIAIPLHKVHERLKSKNARLTLTMYDCCNYGTGINPQNLAGAARSGGLQTVYTTLFARSKGDVMMCSSKQGQYSMGISSGGLFTSSFLTCLNRLQDVQDISWQKLYSDVQKETKDAAQSLKSSQISGDCNPDSNGKCQQCPDAAINASTNPINGGSENRNAPGREKVTGSW